ncbi:hypothetical protein TNCV_142721 [Trichonephila clavipes]|nr:hypothetical protein TNCV_142721 [Trichonephila clavipes]
MLQIMTINSNMNYSYDCLGMQKVDGGSEPKKSNCISNDPMHQWKNVICNCDLSAIGRNVFKLLEAQGPYSKADSRTRRNPHCGRGPGPGPIWPML